MADFCTNCHNELFPGAMQPEIDIEKMWEEIKEKEGWGFGLMLCEGCGLRGFYNIKGKMHGQYEIDGSEVGHIKPYVIMNKVVKRAEGSYDLPYRDYENEKDYFATAKIYGQPSKYGIGGGRISKLSITRGDHWNPRAQVYNWDRGLDIDNINAGVLKEIIQMLEAV